MKKSSRGIKIQFLFKTHKRRIVIFRRKMKPEALNIIKMISKPINERMPFQGIQLTKFIQRIPFFARFFPTQAQKFVSFCLSANLMQFESGTDIFEHQQTPQYIYIIIDGEVKLTQLENKRSRVVRAFDLFGNVEVVFQLGKRGISAQALSDVSCMVLYTQNFKEIWTKKEEIDKTFHYLMISKYFQNLTTYEKQSLSLLMMHGKFRQGEILIKEQKQNNRIYFIIYGKLQVTKMLTINGVQKQAIIDEVQEMDSFGEHQALSGNPSSVSLQAICSGTYYSLIISQVINKDHPVMSSVRMQNYAYPSKQQLQFRYQVQAQVQKQQKRVKKMMKMPQLGK